MHPRYIVLAAARTRRTEIHPARIHPRPQGAPGGHRGTGTLKASKPAGNESLEGTCRR